MKKRKIGRTLSRTRDQRTALKRTLLVSLAKYGQVTTTLAKAKELRPFAERMITRAKKATDQQSKITAMRQLKKDVNVETAHKLIELAKAFSDRAGGYIRIVKLPFRKRDAADMALIQWTGGWSAKEDNKGKGKKPGKGEQKKQEKKKKEEKSKK